MKKQTKSKMEKFFLIKTLGIPQNIYSDLFIGDIDDPSLRAIVKYRKHPSILAINKRC